MFKRYLTAVLLSIMVFSTGCDMFNPITPMIQLGVMWVNGEASKYYNTDQETIHVAVKKVLKDLEFTILEESDEGDYLWIKATDGTQKVAENGEMVESHFKIKIKEVRHNITKLSIRVNTWGDRPYAELIYRHVDEEKGVKQFVTVDELNTAMKVRKRTIKN